MALYMFEGFTGMARCFSNPGLDMLHSLAVEYHLGLSQTTTARAYAHGVSVCSCTQQKQKHPIWKTWKLNACRASAKMMWDLLLKRNYCELQSGIDNLDEVQDPQQIDQSDKTFLLHEDSWSCLHHDTPTLVFRCEPVV